MKKLGADGQVIAITNAIQAGEHLTASEPDGHPRDRDSDGNLYVRHLYWNGDRWNWNYNRLDNDWNSDNPAAVSANLFMTPSDDFRGSFVL